MNVTVRLPIRAVRGYSAARNATRLGAVARVSISGSLTVTGTRDRAYEAWALGGLPAVVSPVDRLTRVWGLKPEAHHVIDGLKE